MMSPHIDRRRLLAAAGGMALFAGFGSVSAATPKFRRYPFSLGVASGDPWPDGFVIWTRLAPDPLAEHGGMPMVAVPVCWEVSEDARFTRIVRSGEAVARPEFAHAVHVEVDGLRPHRPYWYRFRVDGAEASTAGTARTAPAAGAGVDRLRIAVAGCQAYPHGWYDAWHHLSEEVDLDAVFHYGDYIYETAGHPGAPHLQVRDAAGGIVDRSHFGDEIYSLDDYRRRYAQYKGDRQLQAAHAAAAFVMSFDDHEVDNDWASAFDQDGTPPEAFALRRFAAMQAWYEHMPVRRAQLPGPRGIVMHRRLDFGALLRMHVLDTRSYRDDQSCTQPGQTACRTGDAEATILGDAQRAWLDRGLRNKAGWNLIAQQVFAMPLYETAGDGTRKLRAGPDSWSGYPGARKQLVRSICRHDLTNVVIATGDAHIHAVGTIPVRDDEPDGPAAATEFLATSITSGGDGSSVPLKRHEALLAASPNVALLNDQRGYQIHDITAEAWHADVKVMDRVQTPGGSLDTLARFVVTPDKARLDLS